ncbi:MAG: PorT family protein, partial [Desulfobacterales bacterium]|nr:PorT family protein [Desulfobacterales bacterium]
MRRFIVFLFVFTMAVVCLSAADVSLGAKIGFSDYNEMGPDWNDAAKGAGWENQFLLSLTGGMYLNTQFSELFGLQVEAVFNTKRLKYKRDTTVITNTFTAFSIPVLMRFNFDFGGAGLYFLAGPQVDFLFDKFKQEVNDGGNNTFYISQQPGWNRVFLDLTAGIGAYVPVNSGFFDIGLRYTNALTRYDSDFAGFYYSIGLEFGYCYTFRGTGRSERPARSRSAAPAPSEPSPVGPLGPVVWEIQDLDRPTAELLESSRRWVKNNFTDFRIASEDWDRAGQSGMIRGSFVDTASFSPDGARLLTYSRKGPVRLWHIRFGAVREA